MLNITKLIALSGLLVNINTASAIESSFMPVQKEGFLFQFQGCQAMENSDVAIVCNFLVENLDSARKSLVFHPGKSQFADSGGNIVTSSAIQIGNNTLNASKVISDELVQGVPIKGSVIFRQAPEGGIRLIDLFCTIGKTIDRSLPRPIDLSLYPDEFNVEFKF